MTRFDECGKRSWKHFAIRMAPPIPITVVSIILLSPVAVCIKFFLFGGV